MRNQSLDGVRALLALWVVFGHLAKMVGAKLPLIDNPAVAVDLFMILSGYFIATAYAGLARQCPPPEAARRFLIRRFMRIWPLYAVLLTLCWLGLDSLSTAKAVVANAFPPPLAAEAAKAALPYAQPGFWDALLHYTVLFGLVPSQATSTPLPDWSLSLEFQFYLLYPLLVLALRRHLLWLVFLSAGLAFVSPKLFGEYLEPGRFAHFYQPAMLAYKLNFFLLGVVASRLFNPATGAPDEATQRTGWLAVMLCMVPMGAQAALGAFAVYFLMAQPTGRAARWLGHRVLAWLGQISFTIYLVHVPVLRLLVGALAGEAWFLQLAPLARYGVAVACALPVVLLASQLLWLLVESPGIKLAHAWTKGRRSTNGMALGAQA